MSPLSGRQVYLTGFMATGKSKVGPILAERLGRAFVDTDDLVVEAEGRSIQEIFEKDGEAAFRRIEHACVVKASEMPEAVISLGGGAITQERNWDTVRATGVCVCLRATAETIFERVSRSDERPLLSGLGDEERMARIRQMLAERATWYDRADVAVMSTEERTPEETAELVIVELERLREE